MAALNKKLLLQDRALAGRMLGRKLSTLKHSDAVVVGIPTSGAVVAAALADALNLSFEVMPCKKIKHPADRNRDLGSVSANEIFLDDASLAIPQEYIYRQMLLLRNALQYEHQFYYSDAVPFRFQYKTVILVDDLLSSSDTMMACLRSIQKQKPCKIIVAVPVVTKEAVRKISAEADDVVFLQEEIDIGMGEEYFEDFSRVSEGEVLELLNKARALHEVYS